MTWDDFRRVVEMHLSGVAYEQCDLIAFLNANAGPIDCEPDPLVWAREFAEMLREQGR